MLKIKACDLQPGDIIPLYGYSIYPPYNKTHLSNFSLSVFVLKIESTKNINEIILFTSLFQFKCFSGYMIFKLND